MNVEDIIKFVAAQKKINKDLYDKVELLENKCGFLQCLIIIATSPYNPSQAVTDFYQANKHVFQKLESPWRDYFDGGCK